MRVESMDANSDVHRQTNVQQTPEIKVVKTDVQVYGPQPHSVEQKSGEVTENASGVPGKNIFHLTSLEKGELPISEKQLIEAIEKANKASIGRNTSFRFSVHEATKRISIRVLDSDTNEVIREIPPEKVLDMVAKLYEMAGVFVDEKG